MRTLITAGSQVETQDILNIYRGKLPVVNGDFESRIQVLTLLIQAGGDVEESSWGLILTYKSGLSSNYFGETLKESIAFWQFVEMSICVLRRAELSCVDNLTNTLRKSELDQHQMQLVEAFLL